MSSEERGNTAKPGINVKSRIRAMTTAAMLSAMSSVLMMFDFPVPFFPSFLKLDFSDVPAFIGAIYLGPVYGAVIAFVKILVHLTRTDTGGVGEIANFVVAVALVVPAAYSFRASAAKRAKRGQSKNSGELIVSMIAGVIFMAMAGSAVNYLVMLPWYIVVMGFPEGAIVKMCQTAMPFVKSIKDVAIFVIVPFNILKGTIECVLTYLIYNALGARIKNPENGG
ncbi:MAG: ECF transporter S component [Clostridiales bacterium]|nr:ECF transporter S component [Clostridiales bacterium]